MQQVEVYTSAYCPYCMRAKSLLDAKGVTFTELAIDKQAELRSTMMTRANGRTSVPQIFIGDTHVGGCDDLFALESAGKLDTLLKS